jgi:hypothetical protein
MGADERMNKRTSVLFLLSLLPTVLVDVLSRVLTPSPDSWQHAMSLIMFAWYALWGFVWTLILLRIPPAERAQTKRWPLLCLTVSSAVLGTILALTDILWLCAGSSLRLQWLAGSVKLYTSCVGFAVAGVLCAALAVSWVRGRLRKRKTDKSLSDSDVHSDHTVEL